MVQTLHELVDVDDSAVPLFTQLLAHPAVGVLALPVEPDRRDDCLVQLQVTLRSMLGAIAYEVGGLLVDHGWLRLLGGGHGALPSLAEAIGLGDPASAAAPPDYVVLGWDVVGGVFALDGGGLRGVRGHVCYFAPDALQWEDLDVGHADFVRWVLTGGLDTFAEDLRWDGWATEAPQVALDAVYLSDPPLWTLEGQDVDEAERRTITVDELLARHAEAAVTRPALGDAILD
ncbi:MAG: DUF2625 family protein [Propionibacteriaceae bacterium]